MILSGLSVFVVLASGPAAAAGPFRSLRIGINPLVITTLNPLKITLADEYVVVYNVYRSEEHTSELQSRSDLVCRLLLEKKKKKHNDFNLPHLDDTPDSLLRN